MRKFFSKCWYTCREQSRPATPNPEIDEIIAKIERNTEPVQSFYNVQFFPGNDQDGVHKRTSSVALSVSTRQEVDPAEARPRANEVLDKYFLETTEEQNTGSFGSDDTDSDDGVPQMKKGTAA